MGQSKQASQTVTSSTTTPTATPEQTELNKLQLQDYKAAQPYANQATQSGLNLSNLLLTGQQLPGYLQSLPGGINEEQTQSMVNQGLRDVNVQLAKSGAGTFMESGASQAAGVRAATDIRNQNAQFNSQNLQQLLNLATGSAAVPLGYTSSGVGQLGGRLQGLNSYNQQGMSNQTTTFQQNPFLMGMSAFNPISSSGGFSNFRFGR